MAFKEISYNAPFGPVSMMEIDDGGPEACRSIEKYNEKQMLKICGEIIHCEECGTDYKIDYQEGSVRVRVGRENVKIQKKLSKKFLPDYDGEKHGYYFHRLAVCESCAKKLSNDESFDDICVLFRYFDKIDKISTLEMKVPAKVMARLKKNLVSETFNEKSWRNICEYVIDQYDFKLEEFKKELEELEDEVQEFISKYEDNIETFVPLIIGNIRMHGENVLTYHRIYSNVARFPEDVLFDKKFYKQLCISKAKIQNMLQGNIFKDENHSLYQRMITVVSKDDIWD